MLTKKERLYKSLKRLRLQIFGRKGRAKPVFIFGEMRSGTNMLIQTLAKSKNTECYFETDDEAFDDYRLREEAEIAKLIAKSQGAAVVFKPIADSQNARGILDRHEGSRAIWIYRRYQDAVLSALALWGEHVKYLHYILYEPEKADWRSENVTAKNMELIRKLCDEKLTDSSARALIWFLRNSLYFDQSLESDDRVLLVNYEKITRNPKREFRRICEFIGCDYKDHITGDIHDRSVGKSEALEIDESINQLCAALLERFNSLNATSSATEEVLGNW